MIIGHQADTRTWAVIEAMQWFCEEELSALILAFMSYNPVRAGNRSLSKVGRSRTYEREVAFRLGHAQNSQPRTS